MTPITSIIFDLDGTLVDSAPGILGSMGIVLQQHGIAPARPLTQDLIGPPLMPTLRTLTGIADDAQINALAVSFKAHYDTEGYRETKTFTGIVEMLQVLHKTGWPMFIATNKRLRPTEAILDMLGWAVYFEGIYALDSPVPPAANKAELLQFVMHKHQLPPSQTLYVGDRNDDAKAADAAMTQFFHAEWGFEGAATHIGETGNLVSLRQLLQTQRKLWS